MTKTLPTSCYWSLHLILMHRFNVFEVPNDYCATKTWLYTQPRRSDAVPVSLDCIANPPIFYPASLVEVMPRYVWFSSRADSDRIHNFFLALFFVKSFLLFPPARTKRYFATCRLPHFTNWLTYRFAAIRLAFFLVVVLVCCRLECILLSCYRE